MTSLPLIATPGGAQGRRRAWFVVVLTILTIAVLELASAGLISFLSPRLVEPIRRTSTIYQAQSAAIQTLYFSGLDRGLVFDSTLGWIYRAGWQDALTIHNSVGVRGKREYPAVTPHGRLRISAFGDSFVYGNEVGAPEAWPALIESADSSLEVLNFGVGGYGVDQAFLRYLREGRTHSPKIVLICFTTDDLRRIVNVYRRFASINEPPLVKPRFRLTTTIGLQLLPSPVDSVAQFQQILEAPKSVRRFGQRDYWYEPMIYENPLYDLSATVRLATTLWIRLANRYVRPNRMYDGEVFNTRSEAFRLQVAVFQAFRDSVKSWGSEPVILLLPDRESVLRRAGGARPIYAPLADTLTSLGLPFLDAGDGFASHRSNDISGEWFMPGGHYSLAGNLVVASWLAPRLLALGGAAP